MNIEIEKVEMCENGIIVSWSSNIGWGQLTIYPDGSMDTEYMNKEFVSQVLRELTNYMIDKIPED